MNFALVGFCVVLHLSAFINRAIFVWEIVPFSSSFSLFSLLIFIYLLIIEVYCHSDHVFLHQVLIKLSLLHGIYSSGVGFHLHWCYSLVYWLFDIYSSREKKNCTAKSTETRSKNSWSTIVSDIVVSIFGVSINNNK